MRKLAGAPRLFERVPDSRAWARWAFFTAAAALLAAAVGFSIQEDRRETLAQEAEWLATLTRVVEKNLVNQLLLTNRALDSLIVSGSLRSMTLEQLASSLPGVRTLSAIDRAGLVTASNRLELVGLDFSTQDYFVRAATASVPDELTLSLPFESVLGVVVFNAVKTVYDREGHFQGIVAASFDPEYFKVLLDSVRDHDGSWARLYHGAGYQYLTMTEGKTVLSTQAVTADSPFVEYLKTGLAFWNRTDLDLSPEAVPSMASFREIHPPGLAMNYPLVVEIGQDLTPLRTAWAQADLFAWGSFTVVVVTLGAIFLFVQLRQNRHQRDSRRYNAMIQEGAMRFQLATEAAHLGVWEWNANTGLLTWDTQMFRLYGLDAGDFIPSAEFWESLIWDDEKGFMRGFLPLAAAQKMGGSFRCRVRHSDGMPRVMQFQYRYHSSDTGEGRLIGINNDITLDVTNARALLESERFLRTATETAPSLIAYYDRKAVCRFANSRYAATHGYASQDIVGLEFQTILGAELHAQRTPAILDALAGNPTDIQTETVDASGLVHSYWVHYIPDVQDDGVAGFFVLIDELTELRTAQKELEAQQGKMILNARMAQMGELLSMIAHQWRQPLTVIGALVGNIHLRSQLGSLNMAYLTPKLDKISETVQFLSSTIESFRNFYAPTKKKTATELADLTKKAVDLLSPAFQKSPYEIRLLPPAGQLMVLVNQSELMQVIMEILSNARAALGDKPGWIQLRLSASEDLATLEISNNGGAIPPEVRSQIFEPYFTTKKNDTGTGMGLYMARLIIENHHEGKLKVDCTGEVTSFLIQLALHKDVPA